MKNLKLNNLNKTEMLTIHGGANECCSCSCTCTTQEPKIDANTATASTKNAGYKIEGDTTAVKPPINL